MRTSFPKGKIEVVLLEGIHPDGVAMFEAEGLSVRTEPGALEGPELAAAIGGAHLLGIRSKTRVTAQALASAPRLLAVGCFCIGTNQVALGEAAGRGVAVFNAPFSNTRSVAELTIAEVIMLSRRAFERSSAMHAGRWVKSSRASHEVRGKTLGIVGYGHIGTQVSVLAEAMGMRVVFFDTAPKLPLGNAEACRSLSELLERSDAVTLHVPATASTAGMIGAAELGRMRRGAHLINNARGSVVDLGALAAALRSGAIGGAAIDVFPEEPASSEAPFQSELSGLANVILTPHVGGSTVEAQAGIASEVAGKLLKFLNEGSTAGAVNVPEVDPPPQAMAARAWGLAGEGRGAGDGRGGVEGPRPHRILHFHRNVPGVLGGVNGAISELGVNVASQMLQTRGEFGYVVLDVDPASGEELKARLDRVPGTIRTRILW